MGCDIHLYVEVKREGAWESAHEWTIEDGWLRPIDDDLYDPGRNYRLFAMLADVRNGRGFAGVRTGDAVNPIDDPRGLPDELAPETYQKAQSWSDDGHSYSWFTVRELLEYDWTQVVENTGVVSALEFWAWDRYPRSQGKGPESYSGGVGGATVRMISEVEMREKIAAAVTGLVTYREMEAAVRALATDGASYYCQVTWTEHYFQMASYFLSHVMPRLWHLGAPDDVRIVFWFDN